MDSPCIKQTVCKVLKIFQYGKYLVAYVLKLRYFGEYKNNLDGYFSVHASGLLQIHVHKKGAIYMHMMFVLYMFFFFFF